MVRLLFIFIFLPLLTKAQNSFADDDLLQRLSDSLPKGWTMVIKDSELIISRHDSVWERYDNRYNAPPPKFHGKDWTPPTEEEKVQIFMKEGHKVLSQKIYRLEPKWAPWTMVTAWFKNDSIHGLIKELPKKYKIDKLKSGHMGYEDDTYLPNNKEEEDRVNKFYDERKRLQSALVNIPEHNSSKYSLFEKYATGFANYYIDIWPPEAVKECDKVEELMLSILGRRVFR
jgi:hypothetical protein